MSNIYKIFKNDKKETDGVSLNYGEFSIKIKRAGGLNKDYVKCLSKYGKQHEYAMKTKNVNDDKAREIFANVYAESVIVGWDNVLDEKNNNLEFTQENCLKILLDLPDLFDDIIKCANDVSLFRKSEEYAESSKKQ